MYNVDKVPWFYFRTNETSERHVPMFQPIGDLNDTSHARWAMGELVKNFSEGVCFRR